MKSFIDSFLASPSEFPTGIVLSSLIPAASKLSDYRPENNKLQKKLSSELAESSLNVLKASVSMRDAAHFHSLTGKGVGAWISVVPSSAWFAIDSCVYRLACMLRLGLPVCPSEWLSSCECGELLWMILDITFCLVNSAEDPFGAMNLLQRFWRNVSGSFTYHAEGNLGIGIPTLNIGLIFCRWIHHLAWELIWISRWHTWSGEVFPSSAKIDSAAAKCREEKNKLKYKGQRLPDGEQVILKPLVLKHSVDGRGGGDFFSHSLCIHGMNLVGATLLSS